MKNPFKKLGGEKFVFASDMGVKAIAELVNSVFGILTFSILARALSDDSYAVVNQFIAIGTLVAPIILFKFSSAFIVFLSGENNKEVLKSRYFTALILSGGMMALFTTACLGFGNSLSVLMFGTGEYGSVVNMMGVYYSLLSVSELSQSFFRATKQLKKASVLIIVKSMLIFAVFITAALIKDFTLNSTVLLYTGIEFVMAFISIMLVVIYLRGVKYRFDAGSLREYYKYSLPLMPYAVLSWISTFIGRFIVNHLLSLSDSAIYGFNSSMIQRAFFMSTVIGYTVFPYISKFWNSGEKDKVVQYLERAFNVGFLFGMPIVLGIGVTLPTIVSLLSGGNYDVRTDLVLILGFSMMFQMMYIVVSYLIDLSRKTMWYNFIFLVTCGINIGLNFVLIPLLGINGAAIALLVNYLVQFIFTLIIGSRTAGIKIKISPKHIAIYVASSLIMAGITMLIYSNTGLVNFAVSVIVACVVYGGSVFGLTKLFKIKFV